MLALGADLMVTGPGGVRIVAADDFFRGVFETAVGEGEMLTEIRVPKLGTWTGWSYLKFNRRAQDWATVGVAVVATRENGSVTGPRIALTNMGATPLRASAAEEVLTSAEAAADAAARIADGTEPPDDTSASSEFRAHLARVVGRRAIEEALSR